MRVSPRRDTRGMPRRSLPKERSSHMSEMPKTPPDRSGEVRPGKARAQTHKPPLMRQAHRFHNAAKMLRALCLTGAPATMLIEQIDKMEDAFTGTRAQSRRIAYGIARMRLDLTGGSGEVDHLGKLDELTTFEWMHDSVDMQIAETWFALLALAETPHWRTDDALHLVAAIWGAGPDDIRSGNRAMPLIYPRFVFIRCAYELGFTTTAIQQALQKDRKTIHNAIRRTERILEGIIHAPGIDHVRFASNGPFTRRLSPPPNRKTAVPHQKRSRASVGDLRRPDRRKGPASGATGEQDRGSPVCVQPGSSGHCLDGQS